MIFGAGQFNWQESTIELVIAPPDDTPQIELRFSKNTKWARSV